MAFFKNLKDKAKEHIENVKSNVSRQDALDLVTDCVKDYAKGGDENKMKAGSKLLMGLGKMAVGKYEGASRKLETIHKDPYDIQQAEETKDELNSILANKLNIRKFVFGSPEVFNDVAYHIVSTLPFMHNQTDQHITQVCEWLDQQGISYDREALDSAVRSLRNDKKSTNVLAIREQVDKFIFIDRMTKEEILAMLEGYEQVREESKFFKSRRDESEDHPGQKLYCEYCGVQFGTMSSLRSTACPDNPNKKYGPHKPTWV